MERAEWLKEMRHRGEVLYDQIAPKYWVAFGLYENLTHLTYLEKFQERLAPGGTVLSAACGAGRYDGLLGADHPVTGIDQSAGMLKRAQERCPEVHYEKMGLQDMDFHAAFDGVICIDAMEHICPEDYPVVLRKFAEALKPGGLLYFTMDVSVLPQELQTAYERARSKGLPVVFGELVDPTDRAYKQVRAAVGHEERLPDDVCDGAVYHFYPSFEQAHQWLEQAGLAIEQEGPGSGYYYHFLAKKKG